MRQADRNHPESDRATRSGRVLERVSCVRPIGNGTGPIEVDPARDGTREREEGLGPIAPEPIERQRECGEVDPGARQDQRSRARRAREHHSSSGLTFHTRARPEAVRERAPHDMDELRDSTVEQPRSDQEVLDILRSALPRAEEHGARRQARPILSGDRGVHASKRTHPQLDTLEPPDVHLL